MVTAINGGRLARTPRSWSIFGRDPSRRDDGGHREAREIGESERSARLKRGRQPHWQALVEGRVHLGWQCWKGDPVGRWLLRRYIGNNKYRVQTLGRADDAASADGADVLSFAQAEAKARAMVASPEAGGGNGKIVQLTVRQAMARYIDYKRHKGQPVGDLISRSNVHILPALGDLVVSELSAEQLRRWLATMAAPRRSAAPKATSRSTGPSQPPTRKFASAAPVLIGC